MLAKNADDRPTLAAVRAVLKRLRGTKIPTMTAAGLQMPRTISSELPPPPTDDASFSAQMTAPRIPQASASSSIPALPPPPVVPPNPAYAPMQPYMPHPPSSPPYAYPQASLPPAPLQFPSAAGLLPAQPATIDHTPARRWIVIVIAAVVATAIGIAIALAI
jgi:hypothetical protein